MPIIGRLVRMVGAGIGASREAYLERQEAKQKAKETAAGPSTSTTDRGDSSTNAGGSSTNTTSSPPAVVENSKSLSNSTSLMPQGPSGEPAAYDVVETTEEHAQELIAAGKAIPVDEGSSDSDEEVDDDENEWRLDEAAEAIDPPNYDESEAAANEQHDAKELVAAVLKVAPPVSARKGSLEAPVVLPQRRPRAKGRGFVRAYAPLLNDCAIDQRCFLTFLKNLHAASKASKSLSVVFIAATIVGFVPETIAQIVSTVVQFGAGTAIEVQARYRANAFLDTMNEKLFRPRGLFAMVVAYKPDQKKRFEVGDYDATSAIARFTAPADGGAWRNQARKLRTNSGKDYGGLDIGAVAPLVFPSIVEAGKEETEAQRGAWKKFGKFMGDYGDRRAQALYAKQNPNSALAVPDVQFKSRYSDPNHPANSGSIVSLITGGYVNPLARKQRRREARRQKRSEQWGGKRPVRPEGGYIKKALQEDVVYLMIVNMPSEEELAAARAQLVLQKSKSADKVPQVGS